MGFLSKVLLFNILIVSITYAKVTPSDVFMEAKVLKLALAAEVIKQKGVSLLPIIDIDLKGTTPSSVYAMAAVLNNKLQIYARVHKKVWKPAVFPNKKITPENVKNILLVVEQNLQNIFDIQEFIKDPVKDKTPENVMVELTYANLWLDKLMPPVKPQYPFAILKKLEKALDRIYAVHNVKTLENNPKTHANITPNEVFINVTTTYNLLRNIKLVYTHQSSPSHPYNILTGKDKIKPLDIFTISTFNLYFLYSTTINLGIDDIDTTEKIKIYPLIKPNDVFRQADIVNSKIANLIAEGGLINVK